MSLSAGAYHGGALDADAGLGGLTRDRLYALFSSLLFHGLLMGVCLVGLPLMTKTEPVRLGAPIQVELVQQKPARDEPAPKAEEKPKPKPPQVSAVRRKPAPPKALRKPSAPASLKEPAVVPLPEAKKDTPEPKPEPAPKPKKEPEPAPDQGALFSSLLKNLAPDAQERTLSEESELDAPGLEPSPTPAPQQLTMGELEAFKAHIAPCWNVQSGSKYAEDLVVEVKVNIGPDRMVRAVSLVDQVRYSLDSHYRAAADAALRALRNPACQPFDLPADKYEQWQVMTIRFDPQEML